MNRINVNEINYLPESYPQKYIDWAKNENLQTPCINTISGVALSLMLEHPNFYFDRVTCTEIFKKFNNFFSTFLDLKI